eukprot:364380-Chlamydomonas_euryale.AAC.11
MPPSPSSSNISSSAPVPLLLWRCSGCGSAAAGAPCPAADMAGSGAQAHSHTLSATVLEGEPLAAARAKTRFARAHMRSSSLAASSPPSYGRDRMEPISYSVMPAPAQRCSSAVVSSSTRTHSGRSTGSSRASSSRSAAASSDRMYASSSSLNGSMACGQCSHSK